MSKGGKIAAVVVVACSLLIGLAGCFVATSSTGEATVSFSHLVATVGGPGEVTVSVRSMPGGGLGALAVGTDGSGFRYDPTQFRVTGVVGANGFMILSFCINNASGEVRFVAVNPVGGEVTGDVVRIMGDRLGGGPPGFAVSKASLQLCDAQNEMIGTYALTIGQAPPYYVKGER